MFGFSSGLVFSAGAHVVHCGAVTGDGRDSCLMTFVVVYDDRFDIFSALDGVHACLDNDVGHHVDSSRHQ